MLRRTFLIATLAPLVCAGGCFSGASRNEAGRVAAEDSAIWLERDLNVEGMTLSLGYRKSDLKASNPIEPVVQIIKDKNAVADAMVFAQLVSTDGQTTFGDEAPTVFEDAPKGKRACYIGSKLQLPESAGSAAIRFRVIWPEVDEEWTKDVALQIAPPL